MKKTALITGASSGIGRELAWEHARRGGNLVLVARSTEALLSLKDELYKSYGTSCHVIVADLSQKESCQNVYDELSEQGIHVDYLINNAGFGAKGEFHELPLSTHQQMVDVNIRSLTELSRLFLPDMVERRSGKILNIASSAAYLPGPLQAVYYASKSYVLSLSLAMSEELRDKGITVTACCPGPVATEFFRTANMQGLRLVKSAQSTEQVARRAYRAMLKGKRVNLSAWPLRILPLVTPLWNTRLLLMVSKKAMEL